MVGAQEHPLVGRFHLRTSVVRALGHNRHREVGQLKTELAVESHDQRM